MHAQRQQNFRFSCLNSSCARAAQLSASARQGHGIVQTDAILVKEIGLDTSFFMLRVNEHGVHLHIIIEFSFPTIENKTGAPIWLQFNLNFSRNLHLLLNKRDCSESN